MSFLDIVSKFNQQADSHSRSQSLNPFSEQFEQSRSPSPRFSREDYGKPVAGSKTDLRGRKAKSHICREILELCTVIHDVGTYNAKKRVPDDDDDNNEDDGTIIVSFGELFQIYTKISDKVVGLLIAAKRRGFVYFDREILFQRRDDDVLIALLKPISEINKILKEDISQANAPVPAEPKPAEKKKSTSASKTKRVKPECNEEQTRPADNNCPTAVDQTNVILEANGDAAAAVEHAGENDGGEIKRDEVINGGGAEVEIVVNGEENDDGKSISSTEVTGGGETAVENVDDKTSCSGAEADVGGDAAAENGDDKTGCSSAEAVGGDAAADIEINGGDNGVKCNAGVDGVVVGGGGEVNNAGEFSESTGDENTRDTISLDKVEEIKTIDVNGSNEVDEDTNIIVDSADDKMERLENIQGEKHADNGKINMTNESIGISNGIEHIDGETKHISPSENC